ncbi:AAA family ATPase [Spirulina sp. 06S082]|uniref:trifunctional serine/threonine-protein kinase/ATP-binding protein/sensor histidine kinase n=1 Tax=Spirulina sp. 06S082 TaxID=3110248 RepID=UPI002B205C8B|nr:AAA family ATPase [Spirulina sp. 06S082]MEA5471027.1 AAA family ATPase [Spirulina sp. 06S082]
MLAEKNLTQDRQLYESGRALIYRRYPSVNEQPVILKTLKANYSTAEGLAWFRREYEITHNLNIAGAVKAYEFWDDRDRPTIVLEDFGGESLTKLALAGNLSISEFLELAIAIADCLGQVHGAGIIHKDINPSNLVFNPETKQVKIIDFGISTVRSREIALFRNANTLEGTLAYISPEQTGRMNRAIDYRSDFYSLGVTFYELLTGNLPFQHCDPVELVHAHIAKTPRTLSSNRSVTNILKEIPLLLEDIILKLMAKNAEDRYQSAYGLKKDLKTCWEQWHQYHSIEPFPLGCHDRGDRLQIPEKLYGRDRDIAALLSTFEGVIRRKQPALCLVKGSSGVGKSALVAEVHKPIAARRGFFISGKFNQLQRETPYSAIAQALSALMRQLLAEPEIELQQWRERLQEALGNNGRVISEIVPELELILGQQPELPQLRAIESQNRFNLTLLNFIRVFTQIDHPLVLFLDDLQWADTGSLGLLHLLMTTVDMGYFLLIGSYRDNEVDGAHSLMLTLRKIRESEIEISEIALTPLPLGEIEKLIADTLLCSRTLTQSLAKLLQEKTGGNPFFLNEFLKALYEEELLHFDSKQQEWLWDINQIRDREMTANVVELLAEKIQKLPMATRQMLQLAACIGTEFDLSALASISEASSLDMAIAEGLIFPLNASYKLIEAKIETEAQLRLKFAHDRIQQAAYSLIPDWEKRRIHLLIGRQLLEKTPSEERGEKIFDIVNQLNLACSYIVKRSEKDELVRLNLEAGKKAKASAARRSALIYLQTGLELLPSSGWQEQYDLTLSLYIEAAEVAYACTEFELLEELAKIVLQCAHSVLDKVRVYEAKISALVAQHQANEAIETALEVLQLLGTKLPRKPNKLHILLSLVRTNLALAGKQIEELAELPPMADLHQQAIVKLLASIIPVTYQSTPQLFPIIVLEMIRLSIRYGNSSVSPLAYACHAIILGGLLDDLEAAYQFGQLALMLVIKSQDRAVKAKTLMPVSAFATHWKKHLKDIVESYLEGYQAAIEVGDIEYAAYSLLNYSIISFRSSEKLFTLKKKIQELHIKLTSLKQKNSIFIHQQLIQKILLLETISQDSWENQIELFFQEENLSLFVAQHKEKNNVQYFFYFQKITLYLLFGIPEKAIIFVRKAEEYLDRVISTSDFVVFHFYVALVLLAIYPHTSKPKQKHLLKKVNAYQQKMKRWAHHAPMNYLHKYYLIEAERHRILGKLEIAADLYDRAIQGAKENEYIQEEALANELAGKFYLARQKEAIARTYLHQAYRCYELWGAKAKTQHLSQTYPQFFPTSSRKSPINATILVRTTPTSTTRSESIDFSSVLKASQTLGSEIVLDRLLAQMMQIILENAAAQRGILVLDRQGNWQIEAEITIEPDRVQVLQAQPLKDIPAFTLPQSILNYTIRTQEVIVLDNAIEGSEFARDEYFVNTRPQSLLCMPLLHQGKLIGLLYLEHISSKGVFNPDRLEVLQILTAQAAIALENALLYSNLAIANQQLSQANTTLEQKVQQRTEELQEKNGDLEKTLTHLKQTQAQLIQAEKMSGIGQMVAGVAHEINNPVSFIYGNLTPARTYIEDLFHLLELYRQDRPQPSVEIQETEADIDLEFIAEDLPKLLDSMQNGAQRIKTIVKGLRLFSRLDEAEYKTIDIHENIESTIMLLQHRLRHTKEFPSIQMLKKYGELPQVTCYASQLNQALFNILTNAIDALRKGDRASSDAPTIRIQTEILGENSVRIAIADNGIGMDAATRQRVFEPFFTTKPIGSGTGLGLSTTYQIIVEHHKGAIACQSQLGKGTEFIIEIPVQK